MQDTNLDPNGTELYEHHLKSGTAFVTEEGNPCTNAEIDKSLKGKDTPEPEAESGEPQVIPGITPTTVIKSLAKERFLAMLAQSLTHIGISGSLGGKVLAAVAAQTGRLATDFAYNPATEMGLIWGWTNGGAVGFPIPLSNVEMGTLISLDDANSYKLKGEAGTLGCRRRGLWLVAYRAADTSKEAMVRADKTANTGIMHLSDPETGEPVVVDPEAKQTSVDLNGYKRGETPQVLIYDEAPFLPMSGDSKELVAKLDSAAQAVAE